MEPSKFIIRIKFKGIDDFHRAIFKDINSSKHYGDCNATIGGKPNDVIEFYKNNIDLLEYIGASFNCEPRGGMNSNIQLEIVD